MNRSMVKIVSLVVLSTTISIAGTLHFTVIGNTGNNMTLLVRKEISPECNGEPLHEGDEIGIFTSDGECTGAALWNGNNTAITVWGDNTVTRSVDGAKGGDRLSVRIWCSSRMREYAAEAKTSSGSGDILYRTDGIAMLSSLSTMDATDEYNDKKSVLTRDESTEMKKNISEKTGNTIGSGLRTDNKKPVIEKRMLNGTRSIIDGNALTKKKYKKTDNVRLLFPVNQTVPRNTDVVFRWELRKKNTKRIYLDVSSSETFEDAQIDSSIKRDDTVKTISFNRCGTYWWRLRIADKKNNVTVCKAEVFTISEPDRNRNYRMIVFEEDKDGKSYRLKYDIFEKSEVVFTIKNRKGKVVFKSKKINTPGIDTITVNTAEFNSGTYNYALKNRFFSYTSSFEIPTSKTPEN